MEAGSIPVSKIEEYAARRGLEDDEADRFEAIIRMMDDAFLSGVAPPSNPDKGPVMRDEVSVTDGAGILKMLRRLAKPTPPIQHQPKPSGRSQ